MSTKPKTVKKTKSPSLATRPEGCRVVESVQLESAPDGEPRWADLINLRGTWIVAADSVGGGCQVLVLRPYEAPVSALDYAHVVLAACSKMGVR